MRPMSCLPPLVFVGLVLTWFAQHTPTPMDPIWARYGATLANHPLRTAAALWALGAALRAGRDAVRAGPGLGKTSTCGIIVRAPYHPGLPSEHPKVPISVRPRHDASMTTALRESIITGPEKLDDLGSTLTIDPCQESFRPGVLLTQAVIVTTAASTMRELSRDNKKVNTVLVTGEIDPLSHQDFRAISENLKDITKKWFPKAQMRLIGYPRFIDSPGRTVALDFYKEVTLYFEAGTQKTYTAFTGESGQVYKRVVDTLTRLDIGHLVIRARFVRGDVDNSTPLEVRKWIKALEGIKPMRIEISSPRKQILPKTKPITATRLKEIASEVEEKTGISVEIVE